MSAATVFLSHTGLMARLPDGRSFVEAAIDGALRANFAPADMRHFAAAGRPPAGVCVARVRECTAYVGVFGFDYGSRVRERSEVSYTELEFLTALEERDRRGMTVFAFLLEEVTRLPGLRPFNRAQRAFRQRVQNDHGLTVSFFQTPDRLELLVFHALITLAAPSAARRLQHLPKLPPNFTGRRADLDEAERDVRAVLASGSASCALGFRGMGGAGKTTLAAALADRLAADGRTFPGGVLWADLLDRTPEDVARDFVRDLGEDPAGLSPGQCLTRFHELVAAHRPLVVLDNLPPGQGDDPAARLLARARGAATLLTTRFRGAIPPGVPEREVGALPEAEALALLRTHVGGAVDADGPSAAAVLEACGRLPLFVSTAGRVVAKGYCSLTDYAEQLRQRGLTAMAEEDERAAAVFDLSWRAVSEPAREVFAALALAPGDDFGLNLVRAWLRRGGSQRPARLLADLANAALLHADEQTRRYRYHDLARDFALAKLALPQGEVRRRLLECYADWDMVRAEFAAVGAFALAGQYQRLRRWGAVEPEGFVPWYHFMRGQAPLLAAHPGLFFQQAFNEPANSPVSRAAGERPGSPEAPETWLEWLNRPRQFTPPACLLVLTGHAAEVTGAAVTADGRTAVSGSTDGTVRTWDLETGQGRASLVGHVDSVTSVALSADGRTAVSGGEDDTVRVWDLAAGRCRATLTGHAEWVNGVAVSADGRVAVSGAGDGTVRVWDLDAPRCRTTLSGHDGAVNAVALSADGRTAASAGGDGTVRVWDVAAGRCRATLSGHDGTVNAVALSADSRTAASGGADGTVRVWNLADGQCRATLSDHAGAVNAAALSADGGIAVSGVADGSVRVWDLADGRCRANLSGHLGAVNGVALSADGRIAVSGAGDDTLRVWDLTLAHGERAGEGHREQVLGLAVSADGRVAVSGSRDETVRVWDLAAGQCRATLAGHTGWVRAVAVSADGRTAVSGADDRTVRVWDLVAGQCRATLEGHAAGVNSVALSADGRTAVSRSHDRTVRVWDVAAGRLLAAHRRDTAEARGAWESVLAAVPITARCDDLFLELHAGDRTARFPGQFTLAACSPDGRHVAAADARGAVYLLRFHPAGSREALTGPVGG